MSNEVRFIIKEKKRRAERVIMQCREEADAVQSVSIRRAKHKLTSSEKKQMPCRADRYTTRSVASYD